MGGGSVGETERGLLASLQGSMERMKALQLEVDRFPNTISKLRQQMRALLTDLERCVLPSFLRRVSPCADRAKSACWIEIVYT